MKQARQFIVHGHVAIGSKTITSPSYMLSLEEESTLAFCPNSNLAAEDHPERAIAIKEIKAEVAKIKSKIAESAKLESGKTEVETGIAEETAENVAEEAAEGSVSETATLTSEETGGDE